MERKVMQEWFMEEWSQIQTVKEGADVDLAYELGRRCSELAELCVEWQTRVRMIPYTSPSLDWGPTPDQLIEATRVKISSVYTTDYGEGVLSEDEDREESEDSGSDLGGDDELLDAVEEFALVDEYHNQEHSEYCEDGEWDDLFDVDPPSSPTKQSRN
ncbi:hypothetical protein BDN67DRAFT_1014942 [Paxillus ammoniavirescens]|nr:hypothetical protein BDN67DRAFT_1014942 [Paxillus ammoniavirescens]